MRRVRKTRRAESDYLAIWLYVSQRNPRAADRLVNSFDAAAEALLRYPSLGSLREHLGSGVRACPVHAYVLYYREAPDGIELLRVLHGSRDRSRINEDR